MHVDIEYHTRKKARSYVETHLCAYANTYVHELREPNNFLDFYSMEVVVQNLKEHQETLLQKQRKYANGLRIYAWSNNEIPGINNVIEIQRQKEETPIAQIVLNSLPVPPVPVPAAPAVEPATKRGRGRPSGSGSRTEQLKIRCSPELLQVLQELQVSSWSFQLKSHADIIHAAVKSLARNQFPDAEEDLIKAIDRL